MKIIRHPRREKLDRPVVALGTFDGVHLGHRKILEAAVKFARKNKIHSAAITFDPHPQEVIVPERGLKLLTTLQEREALFAGLGVDAVVVIGFNRFLQRLSYPEFVEKYLVKKLGVRWVFVGYDYAFGRGRSGNAAELKKLGNKFGFGVSVIPAVKSGSRIVKSAGIRELLSRGEFAAAIKLLGHPYRITGKVVKGAGRGKRLGFPTANLSLDPRKLIPAQGVYAGLVDGKKCVINIGSRPTFGAEDSLVEVHMLNFNRNIRGKQLAVDLFHRLRDEKQFSDVEDLRAQIKKDIVCARRI
jgi:riboflavin kinase/FMN adenylyltransferase